MSTMTGTPPVAPHTPAAPLRPSALSAIGTLVGMELRQRVRSRGWYIMLGIFFVLVGVVTLGALGLSNMFADQDSSVGNSGYIVAMAMRVMFDAILMFVLLLSLLVSPALSANAISGDRASGTLAILQVTPVRTWHVFVGKWVAGWVTSVVFLVAALPWLVLSAVIGEVNPLHVLVGVVVVALEFVVVTGLGVALSAIAGRTLFAVVLTYLLVAALSIGTVIAFGLGSQFIMTTVQANYRSYDYDVETDTPTSTCEGPLRDQEVPDMRRTAWLLAANPFVVLADTSPVVAPVGEGTLADVQSPLQALSWGVRALQEGPEATVDCLNGEDDTGMSELRSREDMAPFWPLGLGLQLLLLAGLSWWGMRRLHTPAGRLPRGQRVA